MKAGDIVYCYKNCTRISKSVVRTCTKTSCVEKEVVTKVNFRKNKSYEIESITKDFIIILKNKKTTFWTTKVMTHAFKLSDKKGIVTEKFYDYFYSPQQLRKFKLNQINGFKSQI